MHLEGHFPRLVGCAEVGNWHLASIACNLFLLPQLSYSGLIKTPTDILRLCLVIASVFYINKTDNSRIETQ